MLTVTACKNAKHTASGKHKLFDGHGLYLELHPNGSKYWRMKYQYGGKEKRLAFGAFPEVSLAEARARRDDARTMLRQGCDPGAARIAAKRKAATDTTNTFAALTAEWLERQQSRLAEVTRKKAEWLLGFTTPLANRPIDTITAPDVLDVLRSIEKKGHIETAHRVKQRIGQVLRYAVATGRAAHDVTADLRGALLPLRYKHRAAITVPTEASALLRAVDQYSGQPATRAALRLSPLLFVRPGELRQAEWQEIDLDADEPEWRIPAEKMKMSVTHIVPLATQAVAILRELYALTGRQHWVFPGIGSRDRPLCENTVNLALRRLGFDAKTMCAHGFRSMASTMLNEQGWNRDAIERQLAHAERDEVRGSYNYAQYLPERRKMMQAWADYLDRLRAEK